MLVTGGNRKKAINLLVDASKTFEKEVLKAIRKEAVSILRKTESNRTTRRERKEK